MEQSEFLKFISSKTLMGVICRQNNDQIRVISLNFMAFDYVYVKIMPMRVTQYHIYIFSAR